MINAEESRPKAVLNIMESSIKVKDKATVQFKRKTESYKETSKTTKLMALESSNGKMEKFMKDSLENQCLMATEKSFIRMEKWRRDNGRKITINLCLQ